MTCAELVCGASERSWGLIHRVKPLKWPKCTQATYGYGTICMKDRLVVSLDFGFSGRKLFVK